MFYLSLCWLSLLYNQSLGLSRGIVAVTLQFWLTSPPKIAIIPLLIGAANRRFELSEKRADYSILTDTDLLALDYGAKVQLLERITKQFLELRLEFAQVSGRYAELKANIQVLREIKSALQSAIRAES